MSARSAVGSLEICMNSLVSDSKATATNELPCPQGDNFGVPFQGDINWEEFSIKWPMDDVGMGLYYYLLSMPREKLFRTGLGGYTCLICFEMIDIKSLVCPMYLFSIWVAR